MVKRNGIVWTVALLLAACLVAGATAQPTLEQRVANLEKAKSNLTWSADFRYRSETVNKENSGHWSRDRIRARVKVVGKVNDQTKVTVRLASGENNGPTSTNQTLGKSTSSGDFRKLEVWLDQAFVAVDPNCMPGLTVLGGKMANPFVRVGSNQLIWDSDINPDGGAFQFTTQADGVTIGANAGAFWIREVGSSGYANGADRGLVAGQLLATVPLDEDNTVTGGVTYYDFDLMGYTGSSEGNSSSGGALTNDYELLEIFGEWVTSLDGMPLSIFGTFVQNTGALSNNDYDTAFMVGGKINKLKKPGSWHFLYDYRDVEKDAVVGTFTDADPFDGGTTDSGGIGGTCHRFQFAYQVGPNVSASATYFLSKIEFGSGSSDLDYNKLHLDIVCKTK